MKYCRRGHELTPDNTRMRSDGEGWVACKVCDALHRAAREAHTGYMRTYRKDNPEQIKINNTKAKLKRGGWTPELYAEKKEQQETKCAICGKVAAEVMHGLLCADHKHVVPPLPRGLLCDMCNRVLGFFGDNSDTLRKASEYLKIYE